MSVVTKCDYSNQVHPALAKTHVQRFVPRGLKTFANVAGGKNQEIQEKDIGQTYGRPFACLFHALSQETLE